MRISNLFAAGLVAVAILSVPVTAHAQNPQVRKGFWINGGLGFASLGCQNCDGRTNGTGWQLSLGGTLSQHVYLGATSNGWVKSESGATLDVDLLAAMVRVYPSATGGFFLTGGLGIGSVKLDIDGLGSDSRTGSGVILGLGYDFRVGSNVSLTPFWNGVGIDYDPGDANFGQLGLSVTLH